MEHSRVYDDPAYPAWQREIGDLTGRFEGPRIARWIAPTDTVVDFGCGAGSLLLSLDAKRKIGVEPAVDSRRVAEARGLAVVAHAKDLPAAAADALCWATAVVLRRRQIVVVARKPADRPSG